MAIYRVVAPHFVCGIETNEGVVVKAAPIMKWAIGMKSVNVLTFCAQKGWDFEPTSEK